MATRRRDVSFAPEKQTFLARPDMSAKCQKPEVVHRRKGGDETNTSNAGVRDQYCSVIKIWRIEPWVSAGPRNHRRLQSLSGYCWMSSPIRRMPASASPVLRSVFFG